jgi:hypothetical protein
MKIRITKNTILGFRVVKVDEIYEVPSEISKDECKQLKALGNMEEVKKSEGGRPGAPLLYTLDESLQLITAAVTIAEIEEVTTGDTRTEVVEAAAARTKELEDELSRESTE